MGCAAFTSLCPVQVPLDAIRMLDSSDRLIMNFCRLRKVLPLQRRFHDFIDNGFHPAFFETGQLAEGDQIRQLKINAFAIETHLMLRSPFAFWIVTAGHVKSGRKPPFTLLVHDKSDVLDVIILIAGDDIEQCAASLLFQIFCRKTQGDDGLERLHIGIGALEYRLAITGAPAKTKKVEVERLVDLSSRILSNRENLVNHLTGENDSREIENILRVGTSAGGATAPIRRPHSSTLVVVMTLFPCQPSCQIHFF